MDNFNVYKDIQARTNGEIYIGVVGPVRTGKSTFIKRFMDLLVLPNMEEEHDRERTKDELPQSGNGRIITTTEPKFIPKEAARITLQDDVTVNVRLIDCVGFMVEDATGTHDEEGKERMVKTPWFDYEIPFTQAAEIGTQKVINNHSSIGIVITCDGSFGEISRENYVPAEERTILELKKIGKPFIVLLNSERPYSDEAAQLAQAIEEKYHVSVVAVNCQQLRKDDIHKIMEQILFEFPVAQMEFYIPKWAEMLPPEHKVKANLIGNIRELMKNISVVRDVMHFSPEFEGEFTRKIKLDRVEMDTGRVRVDIELDEKYYYENMSELIGTEINGEYQLIAMMRELSLMKQEYAKVAQAMEAVRNTGYGVVMPNLGEIALEEPSVIRHGNKFGVKIRAESPSIHMIKANIETEIAPIVGNEQQAQDLIDYIHQNQSGDEGIWNANIFGKSIQELVEDGIRNKISMMTDESQMKLQETMQKIVNDSSGGLVCIII